MGTVRNGDRYYFLRTKYGNPSLAARGRSPSVLRAALFHQLCVAKSRNITDIPPILRLDLAKNDSLSLPADFYHGLLAL